MSKCCSKCNSTLHTTGEHSKADLESGKIKVKEFDEILLDCEKKYNSKLEEKGESWKDMTTGELVTLLFKEMDELTQATNDKESYEECLDIINFALMVASKNKEQLRNLKGNGKK